MSDSHDPHQLGSIPLGQVSEAVLALQLGRPDVIRQRAQFAATIAGAAAAAVATAGGLTDLHLYGWLVQTLVAASVLAWLLTVGGYMHTVAGYVDPSGAVSSSDGGESRIDLDLLFNDYTENAKKVRGRLQMAQWFSRLAIALTAAGFVAVVVSEEKRDDRVTATLAVSEEVARAVGSACSKKDSIAEFDAVVRLADLSESVVKLDIDDPECGEDTVEIRVQGDSILAAKQI
jgi:hypothetical protein